MRFPKLLFSVSAVFGLMCFTLVNAQDAGLPVVYINTVDGTAIESKEEWTDIDEFRFVDTNNPENNIERKGLSSKDRIRGRGNTTWHYEKKPYRLRFRDDISFFGLPVAENWVLLAEYRDATFLANAIAFELGREHFDYQPFTCSYNYVEVYLNGSYDGIYGFTEHRAADPNELGAPGRPKLAAENGWLVEMDVIWDEEPKFKTQNYELPIMIKTPEEDNEFVADEWNRFCDLLASEEFPENGYRDLIDMNTFIDYLLINEIVQNGEIKHPKSVFAYKNVAGKICMGPLWDFDWALNHGGRNDDYSKTKDDLRGDFFNRFFDDPVFLHQYKTRWEEKKEKLSGIITFIDATAAKIGTAVEKNTERWGVIIDDNESEYTRKDYSEEITKLKNWWNGRISFLSNEFNNLKTPIHNVASKKTPFIFKSTIVSDKMEIMLDKEFVDVRFVVYDFAGNVVADGRSKTWDLRNKAGRFVANGSYQVVVEAKDRNGVKYRWSEKLGVKR